MTTITPEALERAVYLARVAYSGAKANTKLIGNTAVKKQVILDNALTAALLAALPELLAAQPAELHQHLLDMLGAKDHADAGRIIGELHAAPRIAVQPAGKVPEDLGVIEFDDGMDEPASSAGGKLVQCKCGATCSDDGDGQCRYAAPVAAEAARIETVLRDALQYVGLRTDGDLATLAERCELWMRESRVLIDTQRRFLAEASDQKAGAHTQAASQAVDLGKFTDADVRTWVERHDLGGSFGSITDARCAFDDARSAHLLDSQQKESSDAR